MFCKSCGLKINETDHFCGACGNPRTPNPILENEQTLVEKSQDTTPDDKKDTTENLSDSEILQYLILINAAKKASHKIVLTGVLWIVGGIVLTVLTGGVLIFWGAPLFGVYELLRGTYYSIKPEKLLEKISNTV